MSSVKCKSKAFILPNTFRRIETELARRIQQRERFCTLERLVQKLFRKRSETMEISSAIISLLTLSGRSGYTGFCETTNDVPYEEAEEEVKGILRKEFVE